jgi:hypothetical protein
MRYRGSRNSYRDPSLDPPNQPGGFFFGFCDARQVADGSFQVDAFRDRFRRPGKSSGPPPFEPSLNVQRDNAHSAASQSRANGNGHNCVPNKDGADFPPVLLSDHTLAVVPKCRACRVSQGCGLSLGRIAPIRVSPRPFLGPRRFTTAVFGDRLEVRTRETPSEGGTSRRGKLAALSVPVAAAGWKQA